MKPKSADILIVNGTVLTLDDNDTQISNGAVAVSKDSITALGPAGEFSDSTVPLPICAAAETHPLTFTLVD